MKLSFKVKSPANIALIKYWGRQDDSLVLPANKSVSFNLSNCFTTSEFIYGSFTEDAYEFDGETSMALEHLKRVRSFFMGKGVLLPFVHVKSENSFPSSCGVASSASSMSALTFGLFELAKRFGGKVDNSDLIKMTRLSGSASAVRSLGEGIVLYDPVNPNELIEFEDKFGLMDVTCLVSSDAKKVSSREGHRIALSSSLYNERQESLPDRLDRLINSEDFDDFFIFNG